MLYNHDDTHLNALSPDRGSRCSRLALDQQELDMLELVLRAASFMSCCLLRSVKVFVSPSWQLPYFVGVRNSGLCFGAGRYIRRKIGEVTTLLMSNVGNSIAASSVTVHSFNGSH